MPRALTVEEKVAKITEKKNAEITGVPTSKGKEVPQIRKATDRPARVSRGVFNGTKGKLKISDSIVAAFREAGWHLHIFNDIDSRIEDALENGYEFVLRSEIGSLADNVVPSNTDLGDKVRFRVGNKESGDGLYAYVMKIPQGDFEEDQKVLQAKNDRIDAAVRAGKNVKAGTSSDGFYDAGISLKN